jgi:hypothetical protein
MADPFARMTDRLLAHLGREAVLRGTEPCNVNIEQGVAVTGEYGEVVGHRTLAYVPSALLPRSGDTLQLGAKTFTLDSLESDDGYTARYFVI